MQTKHHHLIFPFVPFNARPISYGRLPDARFPFRDLISRWVALLLPPGGRRTTDGPREEGLGGIRTRRSGVRRVSSEAKGFVRQEDGVELRPRLAVLTWKTHASKWDYIKGRFIITANRTPRRSYEPPRAIFQQTKVIHATTIRAVKRQ